ncbi:MFS transporter [Micromonospora sp. NPDC050276]|uniref:MFS transporter n=1 Tax=Micromonospora sp. NPDC050276 TaxID=3364278 RepID=UPI0037AA7906
MVSENSWTRRVKDLTPDLRPLRHREFRLLIASGVITMLGSFITYVAIPFQIKELTGSYLAVGLMGAVEIVPMVICGLWGGALADAVDRRRLILLCEVGMAILSCALLVNAIQPEPAVWPLYLVGGGIAALDGLQRPSLNALIPRLVKRDEVSGAVALQSMRWQIGSIVGPTVGGLLVTQAGLPIAYAIDAATFVMSLVLLSMMRAVPPPVGGERPSMASIAAGVRYAFSRKELLGTYVVDIAAMLLAMPMALYPFVAEDLGADWSLGLLYAATSVGALLVTLTSGWVRRVHRHGRAVVVAAMLWGLAIAGFGFSPNPATAVACLMVAGAADMVSGIFRQTIWNHSIPDHLRGRLAGIELLSFSIGPTLGQARAGAAAQFIGLRAAIVSGGLLCVGAVAVIAKLLPDLTSYDERTSPHVAMARESDEEPGETAVLADERGPQ